MIHIVRVERDMNIYFTVEVHGPVYISVIQPEWVSTKELSATIRRAMAYEKSQAEMEVVP